MRCMEPLFEYNETLNERYKCIPLHKEIEQLSTTIEYGSNNG